MRVCRGAICSPCTALAKKQETYHEYCVINLSSENPTHLAQDLKFPTIKGTCSLILLS